VTMPVDSGHASPCNEPDNVDSVRENWKRHLTNCFFECRQNDTLYKIVVHNSLQLMHPLWLRNPLNIAEDQVGKLSKSHNISENEVVDRNDQYITTRQRKPVIGRVRR